MAQIHFEKVTKRFGDRPVVEALTLSIPDGQFFTFVGPSGCGKSTILNLIAGIESPDRGMISFDGAAVNELSPRERDVAMVFQSYALYPHMNVYENIAFPLRMKKARESEIRSEVERVAGLMGIDGLLQRKPKELSGGQRQRVALGRAIVRKPRVFLLDEPLSNLDARLRIEMRSEIKRLHQELKITTVYVTHDQAEALSLSDRMAVLHEGEIQQCGTPREIYVRPANIFVAGFVGSPPMNFVPGRVQKHEPLELDCCGMAIGPLSKKIPQDQMLVGIRPEDIAVSHDKTGDGTEVQVWLSEPAGSFQWVEVLLNGVKIKGVAPAEAEFTPGSTAFVKAGGDKICIFDKDSGKSL